MKPAKRTRSLGRTLPSEVKVLESSGVALNWQPGVLSSSLGKSSLVTPISRLSASAAAISSDLF